MSANEHEHEEELGGFTDDPRAAWVIFSGVVGILWLVISVFVLQALTYQFEARENEAKNINQQWTDRIRMTAEQETDLHRYRWIDKEKGVAGIPIEDAMRIVARDAGRER